MSLPPLFQGCFVWVFNSSYKCTEGTWSVGICNSCEQYLGSSRMDCPDKCNLLKSLAICVAQMWVLLPPGCTSRRVNWYTRDSIFMEYGTVRCLFFRKDLHSHYLLTNSAFIIEAKIPCGNCGFTGAKSHSSKLHSEMLAHIVTALGYTVHVILRYVDGQLTVKCTIDWSMYTSDGTRYDLCTCSWSSRNDSMIWHYIVTVHLIVWVSTYEREGLANATYKQFR